MFAKVDLFVLKVSLLPVDHFVCVTLRESLEIGKLLDWWFRVDKGSLGGDCCQSDFDCDCDCCSGGVVSCSRDVQMDFFL